MQWQEDKFKFFSKRIHLDNKLYILKPILLNKNHKMGGAIAKLLEKYEKEKEK